MRVLKYRDVTRLTLYGRYDKNINDTTSIYSGYDRALTTTTGGGINNNALAAGSNQTTQNTNQPQSERPLNLNVSIAGKNIATMNNIIQSNSTFAD